MNNFEKIWQESVGKIKGESPSPEIRALLTEIYTAIINKSEIETIKLKLENLLSFLCSPEGRTDVNCTATDRFFMSDNWEVYWEYLSDNITDILGDMAGALHDSVSHPEIAENFESTPEQLLKRLKEIDEK